jgi:hypothetical protein
MLHRRRQDADPRSSPQSAHSSRPSSSQLFNNSSSSKSSTRRTLYIIGGVCGLFFILHLLATPSSTSSSYGRGRSLPGFGSRSGFAQSRRTDALVRNARKQRAAAAISHGGNGGYGPANFSEPPPFTFCPTFGAGDELGAVYGREAILKTRAHVGSSERVRRVIKRAMAGLPITVGVLGGSVSSCHGLDATQAHPLGNPIGPNCYPHRVFSWLNDVFPHPANELTNGAREFLLFLSCPLSKGVSLTHVAFTSVRRTGTSYFGFCSDMHLPDRVDLVIVEFDTEDPQ